ncbi:recombinase family protein [Pseudoalteromonas sp. SG43-4]|uniref:recombinase family protein n=1 Tax=Pseudoalteromonas sp. SG43-4 TaxID=2760969 RepID=UPI0016028F7E|nr:recombinase family protein [Pseudoalteromonas sp. SG43-4]MBB1429800.1 recombinase family protein [Pseudoalteromonas sp. SG43-4]
MAIIAYCRVSSSRQLEGLSMSLQNDKKLLEEIAQKFNTTLSDRIYSDSGFSAYHGKNLKNELGNLISDIDELRIKPNDIIVMRHLDRLSRQNIADAMEIFTKILTSGVKIYTTMDCRLYERHGDNGKLSFVLASLSFSLANEESVKKSFLVNSHAINRIKQFDRGERGENNAPYNIGVGGVPFHVKIINKTVTAHPTNFSILQELIKFALKGNGLSKCLEFLSQRNIALTSAGLRNLLKSHSLYGRLVVKIKDLDAIAKVREETNIEKYISKKYERNNFYPAACNEDEWYQLQSLFRGNVDQNYCRKEYTLLSGMKKLHCGCGSSMTVIRTNTKGATYYACINAKCNNLEKIYTIDKIVISHLAAYFRGNNFNIDNPKELTILKEKLKSKLEEFNEKQLFFYNNHLFYNKEIEVDMYSRKEEIDNLEAKIKEIQYKSSKLIFGADFFDKKNYNEEYIDKIISESSENKRVLQKKLSTLIEDIIVHKDGLIEIIKSAGGVDFFYIPEQVKKTGRRLGVQLMALKDKQAPYADLKEDTVFGKIAFSIDEIRSKAYLSTKLEHIDPTLLKLYSEDSTKETALESFQSYIKNRLIKRNFLIYRKKNILAEGVSEKRWQTHKTKAKKHFIKLGLAQELEYITSKGNHSKVTIISEKSFETIKGELINELCAQAIYLK